jgi:rhamnosyl/mannosyltransferase
MHFPDPLSHLISLLMPRDIARVISWHSDIVKQKNLLRVYQPLLSRVTRKADAVVAATQAHFDASTQIPDELPPEKRHVIPYGLDFNELALDARSRLKRDELLLQAAGRPIVFALGRHVYYKGFEVLIEAMRKVDALLFLGGDGPLRNQLIARAREIGVEEKVIFAGRIPESELSAYFHACDVFCLPSVEQSEAFGLVQLEAMACGKPVVCTQLGNGVNVVHQHGITGLAVPPRDAGALACALQALLDDPGLRERMGAAARMRALEEYSVDAMTRRHIDLYASLVKRPHGVV